MPVKLRSPEGEEQVARIEIIPLIDIMFFLLAAFMLVSLSMSHFEGLNVKLPVGSTVSEAYVDDGNVSLSVDKAGIVYWEKEAIGSAELLDRLTVAKGVNAKVQVYIRGDHRATHGSMVEVLDLVRATGIDTVSFQIESK